MANHPHGASIVCSLSSGSKLIGDSVVQVNWSVYMKLEQIEADFARKRVGDNRDKFEKIFKSNHSIIGCGRTKTKRVPFTSKRQKVDSAK